jgi:sulfur carrier protein
MNIKLNGQNKDVTESGLSVEKLLVFEKVKNLDTVAVQINGAFLSKDAYAKTLLNEGDDIEFVYFMGGGQGE